MAQTKSPTRDVPDGWTGSQFEVAGSIAKAGRGVKENRLAILPLQIPPSRHPASCPKGLDRDIGASRQP
jgi:hypothetical protein